MTLTPELHAFAAELAKRVAPHHGQLGHLAGIIERWLAEPAPSSPPDGVEFATAAEMITGSHGAAAPATPAPQGEAQTDAFIAELRNQATKIAHYEGARDAAIRLLNEAAARLTASRAPFDEGFRAGVEAAAKCIYERALATYGPNGFHLQDTCDGIAIARKLSPPAPPSGGDAGFRAGVEAAANTIQSWADDRVHHGRREEADLLRIIKQDILNLAPPAPPSGGDAL